MPVSGLPGLGADVVKFWTLMAFGTRAAVKRRYGSAPSNRDRLSAAAELADRLFGNAIQAIEVDERPKVPAFVVDTEPDVI